MADFGVDFCTYFYKHNVTIEIEVIIAFFDLL